MADENNDDSEKPMNKPLVMLSVVVVGALLQVGCATTSGTKTELTAHELEQIKALETEVLVEKKFEVYLARGKDASTGGLLGGIFGGAIQSGMQSDADAKDTAQCQALLGDFDCEQFIKTPSLGSSAAPSCSPPSRRCVLRARPRRQRPTGFA